MVTNRILNSVDLRAYQPFGFKKRHRVIVLSIILSSFLFLVSLYFGKATNSLLLLEAGIMQAGLTLFFCVRMSAVLLARHGSDQGVPLFVTLLCGFSLALSAGYIICECYDRYGSTVAIRSFDAVLAAGAIMLGNALIILLMVRFRFTSLQIGSLSVSVRSIGKWSLVVLLATATIHITNYYFLDTILSVVLAVTVFIWAAFVVIDTYWRLGELA